MSKVNYLRLIEKVLIFRKYVYYIVQRKILPDWNFILSSHTFSRE